MPLSQRWLVEIVGYWTPEYVQKKLAGLRAACCERLIVCIDEQRCCGDETLDLDAQVVRYRRRLDPRAVLAKVDPRAYEALPSKKPRAGRAAASTKAARAEV
jgi:uncharacterized protein